MKQGAARHAFAERGADLYETPACATEALVRVESLPRRIWEPAAGRGAISRVLIRQGFDVVASDLCAYDGADDGIQAPVDFLQVTEAPHDTWCICTNPPYKLADQFIRHGLTLVPRVIVLLRLMALEGQGRSDLIDGHLRRVWAGRERLPMMHREGWDGPKIGTAGVPFAWFCFDAARRPANCPIELKRMSWRGA